MFFTKAKVRQIFTTRIISPPSILGWFLRKLNLYKKVSGRCIIIYKAIFELVFRPKQFNLVVMSYFWQKKTPRHARASPQELHLLLQFLGDFGERNLYNKVSVRRIIRYEAIFVLCFRSKQFNLVVMSEVLQFLFQKSEGTPELCHKNCISSLNSWAILANLICIRRWM